MARTPKNLDIRQITSTVLTTIYTAGAGINTSISVLSFTNASNTAVSIDIYRNDGTTDFILKTLTLPAGIGRERSWYPAQRRVFNAGHSIKIQADSVAAFNSDLNGSEVETA